MKEKIVMIASMFIMSIVLFSCGNSVADDTITAAIHSNHAGVYNVGGTIDVESIDCIDVDSVKYRSEYSVVGVIFGTEITANIVKDYYLTDDMTGVVKSVEISNSADSIFNN